MKKLIKRKVGKFFRWLFSEELRDIKNNVFESREEITRQQYLSQQIEEKSRKLSNILDNIDVSVDVHQYARSWAVISIQGQKEDYIKFVDLGHAEIREISRFLSRFDRTKVDAAPGVSKFIKMESREFRGY